MLSSLKPSQQYVRVVEHFVGNMKTFVCLKCDDWVKDKQKVIEHGWSLFDEEEHLKVDLFV